MGMDLSATIGYGVCIESYGADTLLEADERDLIEEIAFTDSSSIDIAYAGTDDCQATYILHRNSAWGANWLGTSFNSENLIDTLQMELIYGSDLQMELLRNNIIISGEHFKWFILPRWF